MHGAGAAVAVVAAFLGAGQAERVAQHLEQAVALSPRNSVGSPLMVALIDDSLAQRGSSLPCSCARLRGSVRSTRTPTRCLRCSSLPRMSLIGRAAALAASPAACRSSRRSAACRRARRRPRRRGRRRARPRRGRRAPSATLPPSKRDGGAGADDGDVHLVARDEALRRRRCWPPAREGAARRRTRRLEHVAAGAGAEVLDRHRAPAARAGDVARRRSSAISAGTRVGRRAGVAQVAAEAGAALDGDAADDATLLRPAPGRAASPSRRRRSGSRAWRRRRSGPSAAS